MTNPYIDDACVDPTDWDVIEGYSFRRSPEMPVSVLTKLKQDGVPQTYAAVSFTSTQDPLAERLGVTTRRCSNAVDLTHALWPDIPSMGAVRRILLAAKEVKAR